MRVLTISVKNICLYCVRESARKGGIPSPLLEEPEVLAMVAMAVAWVR
jgi:hypothetical protein